MWMALSVILQIHFQSNALGQGAIETGYKMPPESIAALVDAEPTPTVSISPDRTWMLLLKQPGLPSIEEVSQPELRIAGIRINPANSGPSRSYFYNGMVLKNVADGMEYSITGLPDKPRISNTNWSPDGRFVVFTISDNEQITLWMIDTNTKAASQLTKAAVNDVYGSPFSWMPDSRTLAVFIVAESRGNLPSKSLVPDGPVIQQNLGRTAPARTYQDLLNNTYDESLFEYYLRRELVLLTVDGRSRAIGKADLYIGASPSPDGRYLLVETIHRPYSYTEPMYRFPQRVEVWDVDGKVVAQVADLPLADQVPIAFGSVPTGPRSIAWRDDEDAMLYWVEAQDGGDASVKADIRDRVYMLDAPFTGKPIPLISLSMRLDNIDWGTRNLAIVIESWWSNRKTRMWAVQPGSPGKAAKLLNERSSEDRYNDPGSPITVATSRGTRVLMTDASGNRIFFIGDGASPEGDRPFLDEFDMKTLKADRLFRSAAPYYERPVTLLDPTGKQLLTRRESVTEPPNYFIRDLAASTLRQVTSFPHPTPQLADVHKELIRYQRADGVPLTATLYLPAGYDKERDGPLPMLMWAYPQEYKSANAAGQVTDSPYRFIRVSWASPILWLTHGYAVLDDPSMPIIGEGDQEPNDTYVSQLVASAKAAVDEVVSRGVADRGRIAVGGHSYGAFMTANLLAHSDLFRAGIARSGAYNRTLTPFGFQSEERTYWQAPEIYYTMSPFMHADSINEPILLIHGEADNNSGTFPLQSERFYAALKGQGATARLVMLPNESHGYRAHESVMHVLWEMTEWLDTYVKNAPPRQTM